MKKKMIMRLIGTLLLSLSCEEQSYDFTEIECKEIAVAANTSIQTVKDMFIFGRPVNIDDDLIIEGYVVSSDKAGNFYKTLSIQDKPENPTAAINISIDASGLYAKYEVGRKILIQLKGLAIGNHFGRLTIGQIMNGELQGISSFEYKNHIKKSCELAELVPLEVEIDHLDTGKLDMLIALKNIQFNQKEIGKSFANPDSNKSADRKADVYDSNCIKTGSINIRTSGFSDFKNIALPDGMGLMYGVLQNYYSDLQFVLREATDVILDGERCQEKPWEATISIQDLNNYYKGELLEIGNEEELIFEGYVNSSDQDGNFNNRIILQDSHENPTSGIQLLIDQENYFEHYSIGEKILVRVNRLYMEEIEGILTLGIYKNGKIGQIEADEIDTFILNTDEIVELKPIAISMEEVFNYNHGILVQLSEVQLDSLQLGKAFAYHSGNDDGFRTLVSCNSYNKLNVVTSGNASFANLSFPQGKGSIKGVLGAGIEMRSMNDIAFNELYEYCEPMIPPILISEVADPVNSVGSRFVELFNAGDIPIALKNWKLEKYINGSSSVSNGAIDLSEIVLEPGSYIVIANTDFEIVFGRPPTISSSYISGNGDDAYRLVDSRGKTIDIFGVIGEDGNGQNWEYLDGGAVRKNTVKIPSDIFNFEEWIISSKSNNFLITHPNTPKYAPMDYFIFSE